MSKHLDQPLKGRGALGNPDNRFDSQTTEAFDDGWDVAASALTPEPELIRDATRRIINTNDSPDVPFDRSINPYRGCEHGCIYCFARPSHAYLGHSAGLDFETKIHFKPDAATLLRRELAAKSYRCAPIALGINTDAYQPVERRLGITRSVLDVLLEFRHPVAIVTKSALIERDIDRLAALAERRLVQVMVSLTTLDLALSRKLEPRAAVPERRLRVIRNLRDGGIPVGVLYAPVIPFLNDAEMERILAAVKEAGAQEVGYVFLRLPHELKGLFAEWLHAHVPLKAEHIMNRIRDSRGGKENDAAFGRRMRGQGQYADLIADRFHLAMKRLAFPGLPPLATHHFIRPMAPSGQMELFPE